MLNRTCLIAGAAALVSSHQFMSTSAAHLKVHVEKSHHQHHVKEFTLMDGAYAICEFLHPGMDFLVYKKPATYSIAYFDQKGDLLPDGLLCGSEDPMDPKMINPSWKDIDVDDRSRCFLSPDQAKDAVALMNSYSCE